MKKEDAKQNTVYSYGGGGWLRSLSLCKKKKKKNKTIKPPVNTQNYTVDHLPPKANCFAPGTASFFGKSLGMD